jgi:hypothetical protein
LYKKLDPLTFQTTCYASGMIKPNKSNKLTEAEWFKAIASRPKHILTSNTKLRKDGISNITMPAVHALIAPNKIVDTCQGAGACKAICYASSGCYVFSASMVKHTRNLHYLLNDPYGFADQLMKEIRNSRKTRFVRIHDSGDFTSESWNVFKHVMNSMPDIKFYCYTKMIPLIKNAMKESDFPKNFTCVFSYGGKYDHMINKETDRHAIAFPSRSILRKNGYTEAYNSDIPATNPKNRKVGLIIHGNHLAIKKLTKISKAMAEKALA